MPLSSKNPPPAPKAPEIWAAVGKGVVASLPWIVLALWIQVPYLRALGAIDTPEPHLTVYAVMSTAVYLILTFLLVLAGSSVLLVRQERVRRTARIAFPLVAIALLATAPFAKSQRIYVLAWMTSSLAIGVWFAYLWELVTPLPKPSDLRGFSKLSLAWLSATFVLYLGSRCYSMSVFRWLPEDSGGAMRHEARFLPPKDSKLPFYLDNTGFTQTVLVVHDDGTSLWLRYLSEDKSQYVVSSFPKASLGSEYPASEPLDQPLERSPRVNINPPRDDK